MAIVLLLVFIVLGAWTLYAIIDYLEWYIPYRKRHRRYEYKNYKGR